MARQQVAAFIDGYNTYYGLRQKGFKRYYWLDYRSLMLTFVRTHQSLVSVKYFTSRVASPAASRARQSTYLDALAAHGGIEIIEGAYRQRPMRCSKCGHEWKRPTEKMTDVHVATQLVAGAFKNEYDLALLLCADADLVPAVRLVRAEGKRVFVISPRGRTSAELVREGDAHLHVNNSTLGRCQLPDPIVTAGGIVLTRPKEWQ
jgi:uncharacterized LabA/DUF88 family protein